MERWLPGIGTVKNIDAFKQQSASEGGLFRAGEDGVREILETGDNKAEFVIYENKSLCLLNP